MDALPLPGGILCSPLHTLGRAPLRLADIAHLDLIVLSKQRDTHAMIPTSYLWQCAGLCLHMAEDALAGMQALSLCELWHARGRALSEHQSM